MQKTEIIKEEKVIKEKAYFKRHITCDLCGKKIENYNTSDLSGDIFFDSYEFDVDRSEKIIFGAITEYYNYGTDGYGAECEIFDICFDCYQNKIKPLFKEKFKIEPRTMKYDN